MAKTPPLIHYLGQVLFEAREDGGLSRERLAAMHPEAWTTNSLFRLERGRNAAYWPRDPEGMVELYARATGHEPHELWAVALARWQQGAPLERHSAKRRVRRAASRARVRPGSRAEAPAKDG